jgi:hypothetical protein
MIEASVDFEDERKMDRWEVVEGRDRNTEGESLKLRWESTYVCVTKLKEKQEVKVGSS